MAPATALILDLYEDAAVKGVFWWCLAILFSHLDNSWLRI
jgi:hypothetical protein